MPTDTIIRSPRSDLKAMFDIEALPKYEQVFLSDVWDVRDLPGARVSPGHTCQTVKFTDCTPKYRVLSKEYCRIKLVEVSWSTIRNIAISLKIFFNWYENSFPERIYFENLERKDIESFMLFLSQSKSVRADKKGSIISIDRQKRILQDVYKFVLYLQKTEHKAAPIKPIYKLFWAQDKTRRKSYTKEWSVDDEKFIPESVLEQLDAHLDKLPVEYFPIIVILRASGWRVSDVLNLRWDTALHITTNPLNSSEKRYWLVGDISKTQVANHRVPILKEIAEIIQQQIFTICSIHGQRTNPKKYLFPSADKGRLGYPLRADIVNQSLNRLAKKCNIQGDNGEIFHFRSHMFRHTKAVELINKGMLLIHVQKWLAHASPEMTLRYAKILDNTMHEAWLKTLESGAIIIKDGMPKKTDIEQLKSDPFIEWERIRQNMDAISIPGGYCMKPNKMSCPISTVPCHVCNHFCTTPDHLPEFHKQLEQTKDMIERGEQLGNEQWVQKNKQNLEPIENIINILETGNIHHPAGKTRRENNNE